jgi:menaquinone-dependent protoporphyrinogen IX oxidase
MKSIILYDSKWGFTKEVAEYIQNKIGLKACYSLKTWEGSLKQFDVVYIGSYVIEGKLNEDTEAFLNAHKNVLLNKKVKLFCSALDRSDYSNALQESIDPELFLSLKHINCGGRVEWETLTFFEKRKLKKRLNIRESVDYFFEDEINRLIKI